MASLWKLRGLNPKRLAKTVWSEIQEDDVFGRAAQLSYYFLLALFPLLIFLTSVIGLVISTESSVAHSAGQYVVRLRANLILMLWLFFTGAAVLIGGEVNAEIEHAADEAGVADAKAEGEKEAGSGARARTANQGA
jgi:uncharacterized BrkB/YihY/UPF0761 family membrane protein